MGTSSTDCQSCRSLLSFRDLKECGRTCRPGVPSGATYYCGFRVTRVVSVATIRCSRYLAHTDSWLVSLDDDTDVMEAYLESRVANAGHLSSLEPGTRVYATGVIRWTRAGFRLSLNAIRCLTDLNEETMLRRAQVEAYRHCLLAAKERWAREAARVMLSRVLWYGNRNRFEIMEAHVKLAIEAALIGARPDEYRSWYDEYLAEIQSE